MLIDPLFTVVLRLVLVPVPGTCAVLSLSCSGTVLQSLYDEVDSKGWHPVAPDLRTM